MAIPKMHPKSDSRKSLTADRLRVLLHYDPLTGIFVWLMGQRAGQRAGRLTSGGYRQITIEGTPYVAHHLAWLYVKGEWPADEIDHENCVRDDNRFANLREATRRQNNMNARTRRDNTSGLKGASFDKDCGRWKAQICHAGRQRHLGLFDSAAEAHAAYCKAATAIDPDFARFA